MQTTDLEACVVRVVDAAGRTRGTAFLVGPDLAVTCAHVIEAASAGPDSRVRLTFHAGSEPVAAEVLRDGWHPEEDVAFLRIIETLPRGTRPATLGPAQGSNGHDYQALGYPLDGLVEARWPQGKISGLVPVQGWPFSLLQIQGTEVDKGLSGAPVLDTATSGVVGMLTRYRDVKRPAGAPEVRYAYAIPAETLRDLCPEPLALASSPEETILAAYRQCILKETRLVNLAGIPLPRDREGQPIPLEVPLDRVYIRIQAMPEPQQREEREKESRALEEQAREKRGLLDRLLGRRGLETPPRRPTAADALAVLRTLGEYFYRRGEVFQAEERPEPVDPEAALREHGRLVILGAPGSGKTTLLRYLARHAAEGEGTSVPILVSLRDYATHRGAGGQQSLWDFALEQAARGDRRLRGALQEVVEKGKALWLVDALDEAGRWREDAAPEAAALPGRLVLTSRPVGYERAGLEDLPHFEVLPLTPEDADRFLQDWFGVLAEHRGEGEDWVTARVAWLKSQLAERPNIQPLTRNPLLLTFLVVLAGEEPARDLPTTRAGLYRQYIHELLVTWEFHRRPKEGAEGRAALRLGPLEGEAARQAALKGLLRLGWRLHLTYYGGHAKELPEQEALVDYLAQTLARQFDLAAGNAEAVAREVLAFWEEAGLIVHWRLEGQDYLAFRHLTFQEYAAARALADLWGADPKRAWQFLHPRLHHYAWREVVLLMADLLKDATPLVRRIRSARSPYERELHRDLFLAAEVVKEGGRAGPEEIRRLVRTLGGFLSLWPHRVKVSLLTSVFLAGLLLPWQGIPYYGAFVVDLLWVFVWVSALTGGSPRLRAFLWLPTRPFGLVTPDARQSAAKALGALGDPRAVEPLLQVLRDWDRLVRRAAVEALEQMGWKPGQDILGARFWVTKQNWEQAVQLGEVALEPLLQALDDWDSEVRRA